MQLKNSPRFSPISFSAALASLFVLIFITVILFAVHAYATSDASSDSKKHLITIHDANVTKGIVTDDSTLRQVFRDAGIPITDQDLVEPGLDTKLSAHEYQVNVYRARPITIVDGNVHKRVMSPYRTAGQIVSHAGMKLHDEDITTLAPNRDIIANGAGLTLTIDRATPLTLIVNGKKSHVYTQGETVQEMLVEKGVSVDASLSVTPDLSRAIAANMTVKIWRDGKHTITQREAMKFSTKTVKDADQPIGYRKITTRGKNGSQIVTYTVLIKDGAITKRKAIQKVVVKKPVQQVEVVGTKFTNTFSGSFSGALARLRSCEGSYTSNTGNGYYGAYQFDIGTWGGYKGYPNAAAAPAAVQDQKAWETYKRRGWSPWPSCSVSQGLQDIYR